MLARLRRSTSTSGRCAAFPAPAVQLLRLNLRCVANCRKALRQGEASREDVVALLDRIHRYRRRPDATFRAKARGGGEDQRVIQRLAHTAGLLELPQTPRRTIQLSPVAKWDSYLAISSSTRASRVL